MHDDLIYFSYSCHTNLDSWNAKERWIDAYHKDFEYRSSIYVDFLFIKYGHWNLN